MTALNKFNAPKIAIATAFVLAIGKGTVGILSGSLAVLSSALDSLMDIISSSLNYFMLKKADIPPDADHPFGHGKMEAYASLIQSIVIFITGALLLYAASKKIMNPSLPEASPVSVAVMLVAICASFGLTMMLRRVAKREHSIALESDALHYAVDILSNAVVLVTLIVVKFTGVAWVDPLMGGVISIYIMFSAVKLHISALNIMLDHRIPQEHLDSLKAELDGFAPYQLDYHRLRTRTDGNRIFADVHLTLCRLLTLEQAHAFSELVEEKLEDKTDIDLMIHAESCNGSCRGTEACKKDATLEFLKTTGKI